MVTRPCLQFPERGRSLPLLPPGDVPDRLEQAAVVEPVDPFEGGIFDGLEVAPRPTTVDDLSFEEAVDRLGQRVVVAVVDAAHGWFDAGLAQPLGVANGQVLRPAVGMVDEPRALDRAAIIVSLFEGIEHKACVRGLARPPTDDPACVIVDDKR